MTIIIEGVALVLSIISLVFSLWYNFTIMSRRRVKYLYNSIPILCRLFSDNPNRMKDCEANLNKLEDVLINIIKEINIERAISSKNSIYYIILELYLLYRMHLINLDLRYSTSQGKLVGSQGVPIIQDFNFEEIIKKEESQIISLLNDFPKLNNLYVYFGYIPFKRNGNISFFITGVPIKSYEYLKTKK